MTVNIFIIGLGQIGASIGLALASHKDQVSTVGYDALAEVAHKAQKMGAVENVAHALPASVKEADVIVLALPFDQVHEMLRSIARDVREKTVLIDTAPVKSTAAAWAKELLPAKCNYIGLTPALNPLILDEPGKGLEAARADLFKNGMVAVTVPRETDDGAIKLAIGFVALLGAQAYFADLAEVDGIMAAIHILPGLVAAALTETIIGQPGWGDIRKLAGRPFVAAMRPLDMEYPAALAEAAQQNRENTVRLLNDTIATLISLRDEIEGEDSKNLPVRFERILNRRDQWRRVRADGNWQSIESFEHEMPTTSEIWKEQLGLGRLFGLRNKKKDEE